MESLLFISRHALLFLRSFRDTCALVFSLLREFSRENWMAFLSLKSQSTRGSKIFGNGQKQPYLKLCLPKASHEQVIKSTLFCLLILMWSRVRQFKFDPRWEQFWLKKISKIYQLCMSLLKTHVSQS